MVPWQNKWMNEMFMEFFIPQNVVYSRKVLLRLAFSVASLWKPPFGSYIILNIINQFFSFNFSFLWFCIMLIYISIYLSFLYFQQYLCFNNLPLLFFFSFELHFYCRSIKIFLFKMINKCIQPNKIYFITFHCIFWISFQFNTTITKVSNSFNCN